MDKATLNVMFSSESTEWVTPPDLFKAWDDIYHFTTDPATNSCNPLDCKVFYTLKEDGLVQPWFANVWINPPYGRGLIEPWVKRAYEYAVVQGQGTVVMLLPARTDNPWFQKYIWSNDTGMPRDNVRLYFFKRRVSFLLFDEGSGRFVEKGSPAFPSIVAIFKPSSSLSSSKQQQQQSQSDNSSSASKTENKGGLDNWIFPQ